MEDLTGEVDQALDLLVKVHKKPQGKNKLILDKDKIIYLQVVLFKSPFIGQRRRKFLRLRHSLYGSDPEICLFVPNRKTGVEYKKTTDELIDFCVDHYTDLLEKHKVKGISTVMPLKQLKSEYGTYELRRKLINRFDLFLCKNSLLYNSRFLTALGKAFTCANKEPQGISFPKEDVNYDPEFQKNIERAIFTSSFYINRFSDNYSIPFGCLSNSKKELRENLEAVLNQIFEGDIIPGGIKNIRAMYLWPSQSTPIPLYISPELPGDLKRPRVKSKRRGAKAVEGELSTQPQKKVFVARTGEVFVTNIDKRAKVEDIQDSEDDGSFKDESDVDDEEEAGTKENSNSKDKKFGENEESESEDDEEIERKEARLLEIKKQTESQDFTKIKAVQNAQQPNGTIKKGKKKFGRKGGNEFNNEEADFVRMNKSEKAQNRGKVDKKKRKMTGECDSSEGTADRKKTKKKKMVL